MRKDVLIGLFILVLIIPAAYLLFPGLTSSVNATKNHDTVHHIPSASWVKTGVRGMHPSEFVLNTTLNDAGPDEILIYRPLPPDVSHERIINVAHKFGITGEIREGEDGIGMRSESPKDSVVILKSSGTIEYSHGVKDIPGFPQMPSDEDAIKIATIYLKEHDLFPEGALPPRIYYGAAETLFPNDTKISWHSLVGVSFVRGSLNNISFIGADRASVEMVQNGEVTGYWSLWRKYEPTKNYPIKSPSDAYEELNLQGVFEGQRTSTIPDKVVINNVYLAYHSKSAADKEDYLTPVYVFEGTCYGHSDNESQVKDVREYIPALWEDPAELVSS